jgi:hypothetical protein
MFHHGIMWDLSAGLRMGDIDDLPVKRCWIGVEQDRIRGSARSHRRRGDKPEVIVTKGRKKPEGREKWKMPFRQAQGPEHAEGEDGKG